MREKNGTQIMEVFNGPKRIAVLKHCRIKGKVICGRIEEGELNRTSQEGNYLSQNSEGQTYYGFWIRKGSKKVGKEVCGSIQGRSKKD